ncbi:hypothetical protein [Streptomyces halobius]|uniref:ATP-binding protein n=1 Tax=Streptomyces halobius TaxID=2879846 RepID=A0ABY4MAX9_9ACTN|nr:hypothetical protein [Streptomyces halobius]UQA93431.1 hypothetical protein K9S39_17650 [Streptomyces halobius]
MKQGTIKTLGAVALGAAFAATAAGTAAAAPALDASSGKAVKKLPVDEASKKASKATKKLPTGQVKAPVNSKGTSLLGGLAPGALQTPVTGPLG